MTPTLYWTDRAGRAWRVPLRDGRFSLEVEGSLVLDVTGKQAMELCHSSPSYRLVEEEDAPATAVPPDYYDRGLDLLRPRSAAAAVPAPFEDLEDDDGDRDGDEVE